jgi:hypothetical protein
LLRVSLAGGPPRSVQCQTPANKPASRVGRCRVGPNPPPRGGRPSGGPPITPTTCHRPSPFVMAEPRLSAGCEVRACPAPRRAVRPPGRLSRWHRSGEGVLGGRMGGTRSSVNRAPPLFFTTTRARAGVHFFWPGRQRSLQAAAKRMDHPHAQRPRHHGAMAGPPASRGGKKAHSAGVGAARGRSSPGGARGARGR